MTLSSYSGMGLAGNLLSRTRGDSVKRILPDAFNRKEKKTRAFNQLICSATAFLWAGKAGNADIDALEGCNYKSEREAHLRLELAVAALGIAASALDDAELTDRDIVG